MTGRNVLIIFWVYGCLCVIKEVIFIHWIQCCLILFVVTIWKQGLSWNFAIAFNKRLRPMPRGFAFSCISRCKWNLAKLLVYIKSKVWAVVRSVSTAFFNLVSILLRCTAAGLTTIVKSIFAAKWYRETRVESDRDGVEWAYIDGCCEIVLWLSIKRERWRLRLSSEMTFEKKNNNEVRLFPSANVRLQQSSGSTVRVN